MPCQGTAGHHIAIFIQHFHSYFYTNGTIWTAYLNHSGSDIVFSPKGVLENAFPQEASAHDYHFASGGLCGITLHLLSQTQTTEKGGFSKSEQFKHPQPYATFSATFHFRGG